MSRSNSLSSLKSEGAMPPSSTTTTSATTNSLKRKPIDDSTTSYNNGNTFMNLNTKRRIVSLSPVIGAVSPKSNNISILPMTTTPPPPQQILPQNINTINNFSNNSFQTNSNNLMISNNENSFNFYNNFNNNINPNHLLPRSRRNSNKLMQSTSDDLEMMSLK
ncbi:unnamed protein product [[Candida] boidinii]|nr:unnamed protein product [[Candida] boidinii]